MDMKTEAWTEVNLHALGKSGCRLLRPSPELCSGRECSPQAGRHGRRPAPLRSWRPQAGRAILILTEVGSGVAEPELRILSRYVSEPRGKVRTVWLRSKCSERLGSSTTKTWWRGEMHQRRGSPRGRGGREAAPCLWERRAPCARSRSGHRLPHRPSVLAPHPPAPSPRPAEGAGTTYSPKTRCPGCKQIRASEHRRRGADGAPRRCQVQKRISGTQ